jgi:hypothetical protein
MTEHQKLGRVLNDFTGCGMYNAMKALELMDWDICDAADLLSASGDAVYRVNKDGSPMNLHDYAKAIKAGKYRFTDRDCLKQFMADEMKQLKD